MKTMLIVVNGGRQFAVGPFENQVEAVAWMRAFAPKQDCSLAGFIAPETFEATAKGALGRLKDAKVMPSEEGLEHIVREEAIQAGLIEDEPA